MLNCDEALKKAGIPEKGFDHCRACHWEARNGLPAAASEILIGGERIPVCCSAAGAIRNKQAQDIMLKKCQQADEAAAAKRKP